MSWRHGVALACAVTVVGCVLTVDAVVPPGESAFDPALLGVWEGGWEDDSASARAVILTEDEQTYFIDYTAEDGERTGSFEARLGRLGDRVVLEVWPAEDDGASPVQDDLAVPGHLLFFLDNTGDAIRVSVLEPDSVALALEQGALGLPSRTLEGRIVLLGESDALRAALGPLVARGEILSDVGSWRRVSDTPLGARGDAPEAAACFEAAAWREADRLFRGDPHWVGADVASTVDLGDGRILWLFGDTRIDPAGTGMLRGARMVSNSVAIQTGTDPSTAAIAFSWGRDGRGGPASFIPDPKGERLWFGTGVRVDDRLVLFMSRIISTNTGLGFESVGWTAFLVENPDAAPSAWQVRRLETPTNPLGIDVGFAAASRLGEYVYAFGSPNPIKSHPIYAARWPVDEVRRGDLQDPEWWAGDLTGWVPDSSGAPRWPLFEQGQSELSIHRDPATGQFLAVHTQGFGAADVMVRSAPALTGPWTAPRMLYRPPEYYVPDIMIYAAKAHPELSGADLVLTYATNSFDFGRMVADSLLYYPRFVRLTRCR
jgi:hypothetical protein